MFVVFWDTLVHEYEQAASWAGGCKSLPTESEGRFDVSPSEKCLLQTLESAVRSFSSTFKARHHCCLFFLFVRN